MAWMIRLSEPKLKEKKAYTYFYSGLFGLIYNENGVVKGGRKT